MEVETVEMALNLMAAKYPLVQVAKRGQWWYVTVWVDTYERTEMAVSLLTALNRFLR